MLRAPWASLASGLRGLLWLVVPWASLAGKVSRGDGYQDCGLGKGSFGLGVAGAANLRAEKPVRPIPFATSGLRESEGCLLLHAYMSSVVWRGTNWGSARGLEAFGASGRILPYLGLAVTGMPWGPTGIFRAF